MAFEKSFLWRVSPKRIKRFESEIEKENKFAFRWFMLMGIFVAAVNVLIQLAIGKLASFTQSVFILLYFLIIFWIEGKIRAKNKNYRFNVGCIYLVQLPIISFAIMMGSFWDKNHAAVTFLMLILLFPIFLLDYPYKTIGYSAFIAILASLACFIAKDKSVYGRDIVHIISFTVGGILANLFTMAERLNGIENLSKVKESANHDVITGLRNRYALNKDKDSYLKKNIFVIMFDIDDFKFFNDMYGHTIGEKIIKTFAEDISDLFGSSNCYRYGGDEILVIREGDNLEEIVDLSNQLKKKIKMIQLFSKKIFPTCSGGYVYGTPNYEDEINDMIRQADFYLYKGKNDLDSVLVGSRFDASKHSIDSMMSDGKVGMNSEYQDSLTGLANMNYFRNMISDYLDNMLNPDSEITIAYFDVVNFSAYNETYGFQQGDELLKKISLLLKTTFGDVLLARFGADHFVCLDYKDGIEDKIRAFNDDLEDIRYLRKVIIKTGLYVYDRKEDISIACDRAKAACDSIKEDFATDIKFYDTKLSDKLKRKQYVVNNIDQAVERGDIKVYYQPIVDIKTGKLIELEALARWDDELYGFMSPIDFIPTLEEAHLISKLDICVIKQVCKDCKDVFSKMKDKISVSVNLSRYDFSMLDLVDEVKGMIDSSSLPYNMIHLEVTESILTSDIDDLGKKINKFRDFGFEVWLDDFGSGYSSLNTLQDFNFDVIKVDMRFLRSYGTNKNSEIIVSSIIDMAKKLGVKSLVEGVETEKQYNFLRDIGCDMAQGYLFSKPQPKEILFPTA